MCSAGRTMWPPLARRVSRQMTAVRSGGKNLCQQDPAVVSSTELRPMYASAISVDCQLGITHCRLLPVSARTDEPRRHGIHPAMLCRCFHQELGDFAAITSCNVANAL